MTWNVRQLYLVVFLVTELIALCLPRRVLSIAFPSRVPSLRVLCRVWWFPRLHSIRLATPGERRASWLLRGSVWILALSAVRYGILRTRMPAIVFTSRRTPHAEEDQLALRRFLVRWHF